MSSVFHPEGGYPRLIRFVPSSDMPSDDTLTLYEKEFNLVIINKDLFDALDPIRKRIAERATSTLVLS